MKSRSLIIIGIIFSALFVLQSSFAEQSEQTETNFQTGIIQWSSRCYSPSEDAQVTVIDRDMNLDPNTVDQFTITVWSDWIIRETGTLKIMPITIIETGNSTGIFEGIVFLGSAFDEAYGGRIPVGNDNVIFAKYLDYTPSDHSGVMEIIETTTGKSIPFGSTWETWEDNSLLLGIPLVYEPCMKKQIDMVGIDDSFEKINVTYPAPLKQIESGLYVDEVVCKDHLVLIQKNSGYNYCVNPDTVPSLHERGWATKASLEGTSSLTCYVEPDPGPCKAAIEKYYFDWETGYCKSFTWGGCNGIVPFDTFGLCHGLCGVNNDNIFNEIIELPKYDESLSIRFSPLYYENVNFSFGWCTDNNGFWNEDDSTCYFKNQKDLDKGTIAVRKYTEKIFGENEN